MVSTMLSSSVLKEKFRGCLIGALTGDCLGNLFEEIGRRRYDPPSENELVDFMHNLMLGGSTEMLIHTDDTRMTICLAASLADKGEVNAKDIAERFTEDYYNQTIRRHYGGHVVNVFYKLRESKYEDVFLPARQQFGGMGSYGNGAAMRTAPLGLFGNCRGEEFIMNAAKECALITHYHKDGYRGAILQSFAVSAALELDPSQELDPVNFINNLLQKMENIETKTDQGITGWNAVVSFLKNMRPFKNYFQDIKPYCESLKKMKEYFVQDREDISSEKIAECLGNGEDISALRSVPTAIYSFLSGMKPLKGYESSNPFMRTIYFAISVGGDTDTIASMAGAIAGAYYGENIIPEIVKKRCEGIDEVISLADNLFDTTYRK